MHLSIYLSTYLPAYLSIYLPVCLSIYLSVYLSIYLSLFLSLCLSVCLLPVYLQAWKPSYSARRPQVLNLTTPKTQQFCVTSSFFKVDNIKNEAILRDFLIFEVDNMKNEAILRDFFIFLNLTTSKTKQFCENSSIFELDNIKNKAILRDFLQKWKVECRADGLVPIRFAIFPLHLSKVLCLARKIDARSYESAAPVTQNHLSKPEDLMLQNATPLRKSAPWPPNISDEHVFCTTPATRNASLKILFKCPTPAIVFGNATKPSRFARFWQGAQSLAPATRNDIWTLQKWREHLVFCTFWLRNVFRATTACTFSTSQLPKVVRTPGVLCILTCKCASRHNGVHFFDISTSKSGPRMVCFVHFDLQMCFAPQRRAIFHLSSGQKAPHPPL